jgi:hypothetical protein
LIGLIGHGYIQQKARPADSPSCVPRPTDQVEVRPCLSISASVAVLSRWRKAWPSAGKKAGDWEKSLLRAGAGWPRGSKPNGATLSLRNNGEARVGYLARLARLRRRKRRGPRSGGRFRGPGRGVTGVKSPRRAFRIRRTLLLRVAGSRSRTTRNWRGRHMSSLPQISGMADPLSLIAHAGSRDRLPDLRT